MSDFTNAFRTAAQSVLDECPDAHYEWITTPDASKLTLRVRASSVEGFDVVLECYGYGLYPKAGDWFGGPWDVTMWSPEKLTTSVQEFLRSVLSQDAELEVHYANDKAFRWILHHTFERQRFSDVRRRLLADWLGQRTVRKFRNSLLPPNPALNTDAVRS
jgi:hypothetical protein